MPFRRTKFALVALLAAVGPAAACSLCVGNLQPTLRQEAAGTSARVILFGTLHRPDANAASATEFRIVRVLRSDPFLGDRKSIIIPRYIPADPKDPPRFLVFCDVFQGKLDVFRGVPIKTADGLDYVTKALQLDPRGGASNLLFFAEHLENADSVVAGDAFLELAKATDREIGAIAPRLSAAKLRGWLRDPRTPPERLSLYAFLLGACGGEEDARFFETLLRERSDRFVTAYDGVLGGYLSLRPREGWDALNSLLSDGKTPLPMRLGAVRAVRFFHGWKGEQARPQIKEAMRRLIAQGELADVGVEDLRRWKVWDLTDDILALYGRKGYDGPIVREAIVRYALSCGSDSCKAFVTVRRRTEPELVKQVEESLRFDMR